MSNKDPSNLTTYYQNETAIHDLGSERFDRETAEIGERDAVFFAHGPVNVRKGRAPQGKEAEVFAWHTMKYTTEGKDERAELKGDLHGGQLHRANRVARGQVEPSMPTYMENLRGGGKPKNKKHGKKGKGAESHGEESLRAGMKPEVACPPLAKGFPEELSADLFWNEPLFKDHKAAK